LAGCRPSTVAEAEAKGDVAFLEQAATEDAVDALGRLADKDPRAKLALSERSFDFRVYKVAWTAVLRGADWAPGMLRDALASPRDADLAASQMGRHDPHLTVFMADLERALERLSASKQNSNLAAALASIGPPAHDVVVRRLVDPSTRPAMCLVLANDPSADADATKALLEAPTTARDDEACVRAVVGMVAASDDALRWLAERGETGLLGAAGKDTRLNCSRLRQVWVSALATRPKDAYPAMSVPLGDATRRCAPFLDGVLADTLAHRPAARALIVQALDPFAPYGDALVATCAALRSIGPFGDTQLLRDRLAQTLSRVCTQ
jgi:hypothetical protein